MLFALTNNPGATPNLLKYAYGGVAELVEGARLEIVYAGQLASWVRTPLPPPQ